MDQPDATELSAAGVLESPLLKAAESVAAILRDAGFETILIGGVAMAAHHYIRLTDDLDFALNAPVRSMHGIAATLGQAGFCAEFHEPDSDDPLGGVIDVAGDFGLIQIVNFGERFPAVIEDALRFTDIAASGSPAFRVIPLPHLIALKLYAGGSKSRADIVHLLERNPDADLEVISGMCERYRLCGLAPLIEEAGIAGSRLVQPESPPPCPKGEGAAGSCLQRQAMMAKFYSQ